MMMKNFSFLCFFLILSLSSKSQDLWVKNNSYESVQKSDTGIVSFNPYSAAFFDDKEFVSNTKKGYTYPGFFIQPRIKYQPSKNASFSAGIHTLYFAGSDSAEKIVPVLTLEVKLIDGVEMVLGTIHSKQLHYLPEPLMKPERLFTSQPETGLQLLTNTEHFKGDSWTNWERYIKNGSPFQEVFTMGFAGIIKPNSFNSGSGLTINLFGMGVHHGGQIDSSGLDVTTMINLAAGLSYSVPIGSGKTNLGIETTGFLSSDKSPNPSSKYLNGKAIYPKLFIEGSSFRGELGYWRASRFVNPRGEELFGSYSMVKPEFDSKIRELYTVKFIYSLQVVKGFTFGGRLDTYYDVKSSILDWAFTFRMVFDRELFFKK
jgi:hypothetical protein